MQCCDSAILDLEANKIDSELKGLEDQGYASSVGPDSYALSNAGILYVRKICLLIDKTAKNSQIPQDVCYIQDEDLADEIEKEEGVDMGTIVTAAIRNIEPMVELIKSVVIA